MTPKLLSAVALLLLTAQAPDSPTPIQSSPLQPPVAAPAPAWVPRGTAVLTVLDKVSARVSPLNVKVGESARVGPLTIGVRACFVRPDNVAADATCFLDVTDTTAGAPEFHAWMIASAPAVSAMQHPVYDVRIVACR